MARPLDTTVSVTVATVTPGMFVSEVERFRATIEDPRVAAPDKARAWDAIVRCAALLDPNEPGFERAGVALKEALCLWLDVRSAPARH